MICKRAVQSSVSCVTIGILIRAFCLSSAAKPVFVFVPPGLIKKRALDRGSGSPCYLPKSSLRRAVVIWANHISRNPERFAVEVASSGSRYVCTNAAECGLGEQARIHTANRDGWREGACGLLPGLHVACSPIFAILAPMARASQRRRIARRWQI